MGTREAGREGCDVLGAWRRAERSDWEERTWARSVLLIWNG